MFVLVRLTFASAADTPSGTPRSCVAVSGERTALRRAVPSRCGVLAPPPAVVPRTGKGAPNPDDDDDDESNGDQARGP